MDLNDADLSGDFRVGRDGVDLAGLDNFIDRIPLSEAIANLVMIHEIGKMECFSKKFKALISQLLDFERIFVATVAIKGSGLIAEIKKRTDISLIKTAILD